MFVALEVVRGCRPGLHGRRLSPVVRWRTDGGYFQGRLLGRGLEHLRWWGVRLIDRSMGGSIQWLVMLHRRDGRLLMRSWRLPCLLLGDGRVDVLVVALIVLLPRLLGWRGRERSRRGLILQGAWRLEGVRGCSRCVL